MDNYDNWKLDTPWDNEPETAHCELCDCENSVDALRELRIVQVLMVCETCYDNETEDSDEV